MTSKRALKVIQSGTIHKGINKIPLERLGVVSCSPSIVTIAVSLTVYEIFSIEEYRDLENWVRGCSRSLKMAPFDRPYATTFYWSAIVNIALSCRPIRVI